ncbi:T9SS type A sorting domain-containing protein [Reichenbachiella versicolor]|uniref:T9SS type A sorting domain-containing protein n=1 Tax=Reichenbachiella versicolor TaxID=1821036 RepID=UPI000D6E98DF|nr:T9SS type A sorting domain-containing protein [Reichenbachiella versicolor]
MIKILLTPPFLSAFLVLLIALPSKTTAQSDRYESRKYKDGIVSKEFWYGNNGKLDSLKSYYKNGKLKESFYFNDNGRPNGACTQHDLQGELMVTWTFEHGKLRNRVDHFQRTNIKNQERMERTYAKLDSLNKATDYNPKKYRLIYWRAQMRATLGNDYLALRDFNTFRRFMTSERGQRVPAKTKANVYDRLAVLYGQEELENYALHYRHKALKETPDDNRLKYNMAYYLYKIKSYHLAIRYIDEVKMKWPKHNFSNWTLGAIYSDLGEYEKSLDFLNQALEREESIYKHNSGRAERDLRTIKGLVQHKLGDTKEGIETLEEALEINPNNSFANRNMGEIYFDRGNDKKACRYFTKASTLGYTQIHDREDLAYFIEKTCNQEAPEPLPSYASLPYIFPNPAINFVEIANWAPQKFQYVIYDYQYKLLEQGKTEDGIVKVSMLSRGVYLLKIAAQGESHTLRLIIE